jgi:hypothetical protein
MEPKCSLPHSQVPATCPYSEPASKPPHPTSWRFILILSFYRVHFTFTLITKVKMPCLLHEGLWGGSDWFIAACITKFDMRWMWLVLLCSSATILESAPARVKQENWWAQSCAIDALKKRKIPCDYQKSKHVFHQVASWSPTICL